MNNLFILPLTAAVRISSTIEETISKASETWPFISTSLIRPLAKRREGTQHGALRLMFNNRMVGNLNQGLKPTRQNLF